MISRTTKPGTKVWHEVLGFGTFMGFEMKKGVYKGLAFVEFENFPRRQIMCPEMLMEVEET